jgi:hypothetical protein
MEMDSLTWLAVPLCAQNAVALNELSSTRAA